MYVPSEKHLYLTQIKRNGKEEYICYQKVLARPKNKKKVKKRRQHGSSISCTARVVIHPDGRCVRNKKPHTDHDNHELIYKDLASKNRIIDRSLEIQNVLDGIPLDIPTHHVFTQELSK